MARGADQLVTERDGSARQVKLLEKDELHFSVDSQLWRQLGELLVTRPASALAELIKNSYDADATEVTVRVEPQGDSILVSDNGHGMNAQEFKGYWTRLGSTHKEQERKSPLLGRSMAGSKGIGRISARYLADRMQIETVWYKTPGQRIIASVDWRRSQSGELLTQTPIDYRQEAAVGGDFQPGTTIRLDRLKSSWDEDIIRTVAGEVWKLQPPFGRLHRRAQDKFVVKFQSSNQDLSAAFAEQMDAALNAWEAKLEGELSEGMLEATLTFHGERPKRARFRVGSGELRRGSFEIRIFGLKGRQKSGVRVQDARDYVEKFRGVQVYDAGFRLPHYGSETGDWLGLTLDQSRRLSRTNLIPEELRTDEGLLHLPHVQHLLGIVHVDTGIEPNLEINIGRDRLLDSPAFDDLRNGVRAAIDWYANEKARRQYERTRSAAKNQPAPVAVTEVGHALAQFRDQIPAPVYERIETAVKTAVSSVKKQEDFRLSQISILTPMATAGIGAVAYQHELHKQLLAADGLVGRMQKVAQSTRPSLEEIARIAEDLTILVNSMRDVGGLFSHLAEASNLKEVKRLSVLKTVRYALRQLQPQIPGISLSQEIDPEMTLPAGTLAEWMSLLQNAIFNAANAMIHAEIKRLRFQAHRHGKKNELLILDTGDGVDIDDSERLFNPFERGGNLAAERKAAGFGGTGLGLTIIRMVAEQRGANVSFSPPPDGWSTCLRLQWEDL